MLVKATALGHGFSHDQKLFENLDFDVDYGDLICISGPSGSGKSTLLSIVAGWESPRWGSIEVASSSRIAWVFQNPHGIPGRTALDHVTLPYLAEGLTRAEAEVKAIELLAMLNLGQIAHRKFRTLSGGEAQRLMMARALSTEPDLLLMDEPTAQLDSRNTSDVLHVLGRLAGLGPAIIIATHDPRARDACTAEVALSETP